MEAGTTAAPPKDETATADNNGHGDPDNLGEITVTGTGQLGFDVGGKKPTGSSLRITGGKFKVPDGAFSKGESLVLKLEDADGNELAEHTLTVNEVAFVDEHDSKTGQVIGCERRHKARISA